MGRKKLTPIDPGEILLEEFLKPLGLSQYRIARDFSVPPRGINEIVHGKRGITADTALRLGRYFGTSARFWLNLQARYDPAATSIERRRRKASQNSASFSMASSSFVSGQTSIPSSVRSSFVPL